MAKATFNNWLRHLQGEISGVVFVDQNGQNIARNYNPNPRQPKNAAQQAVTGRFARVAAFWNALTPDQQLEWSAAAAKEKRVGWNLFQSLTNVWLNCHSDQGTPPVSPPASAYAGENVEIYAAAGSSHTIAFTASSTTANPMTRVELWIQPLKRASRKPSAGGYRLLTFADFSLAGTVAVAVEPGAYAAGYRFVDSGSGERTSFVAIPVSGVVLALEQGGEVEKPAARRKAA